MKPTPRHFAVVVFAAMMLVGVAAPAATPGSASKTPASTPDREKRRAERKAKEAEVLRANQELHTALIRADVNALSRLLGPEYTDDYSERAMYWDGRQASESPKKVSGKKRTRAELLAGLKAGTLKFTSLELTDEGVSSVNNAILGDNFLIGRVIEKSTANGKDTSGEFGLMRSYAKRDGQWVCLRSVYDPLIPKP